MALQDPLVYSQEAIIHLAPVTKLDTSRRLANPSSRSEAMLCFETLQGHKKRKEIVRHDHDSKSVHGSSRKRPRTSSTGRSVRFRDASDGLTMVLTPRYVAEEDLQNVWYNRNDYKMFRADARGLALAFDLDILGHIDPEDCCLRGLEANLHRSIMEARRTARRNTINVVLQTQDAQRDNGIWDPEMLRGLSLMLSKDACEDALKLAAYDVEEAEAVMAEDKANQI